MCRAGLRASGDQVVGLRAGSCIIAPPVGAIPPHPAYMLQQCTPRSHRASRTSTVGLSFIEIKKASSSLPPPLALQRIYPMAHGQGETERVGGKGRE